MFINKNSGFEGVIYKLGILYKGIELISIYISKVKTSSISYIEHQ